MKKLNRKCPVCKTKIKNEVGYWEDNKTGWFYCYCLNCKVPLVCDFRANLTDKNNVFKDNI